MIRGFKRFSLLALAAFTLSFAGAAHAATLNILGAATTSNDGGSNPAAKVGGELTFGLSDVFEYGPFYEQTFRGYGGASGGPKFMGAMARLGLGALTGFFVDARLGADQYAIGSFTSDWGFGIGGGVGYRFGGIVSISPRIGVESLPLKSGGASNNYTWTDFGLLFSVGF